MEITETIKTGEIRRRHNGSYCFSCNHCGKYFDVIDEIIDHINKIFEQQETQTHTEFVDVLASVEVKCELSEYDSKDVNVEDKNWSYVSDSNGDDNTSLSERIYIPKKFSDNKSSVGDQDKLTEISRPSVCKTKSSGRKSQMQLGTVDELKNSSQDDFIKCCWCFETFDNFGLMLNHLTDDHNKKPSDVHSCDPCRLFFKNIQQLGEHISSYHGQDEYEKFQKASEIENTKPIQCAVCQCWTYGTKSFDAHTKQVHRMYRILECYVCGIFKKKPSGLLDHLKVHDRFRKYRVSLIVLSNHSIETHRFLSSVTNATTLNRK